MLFMAISFLISVMQAGNLKVTQTNMEEIERDAERGHSGQEEDCDPPRQHAELVPEVGLRLSHCLGYDLCIVQQTKNTINLLYNLHTLFTFLYFKQFIFCCSIEKLHKGSK